MESVKKTASDNASAIETLRSDLSKATEDITKAYKDAISTAINEYDGTISGKIDTKINELNASIESKVSAINTRIDALDARVKTLEDSLADIKSQISALQDEINSLKDKLSNIIGRMVSISHIPTYADGIENVSYTMSGTTITPGSFTLRFEIQPASLATDLASNWNTALSVKTVYTRTRAAAGDFVPLTIESATASDGILSVTVSAAGLDDAFFKGNIPVNARLKISDGTNEILSEYIRLIPDGYTIPVPPTQGDYIDGNGNNFGRGVTIDGVTWAPVNCGYEPYDGDSSGFPNGKLYQWGRKSGVGNSKTDASTPLLVKGTVSRVEDAVDNVFYYGAKDWLNKQSTSLWNNGTANSPIKTEYDPCPNGWRVPTREELYSLAVNVYKDSKSDKTEEKNPTIGAKLSGSNADADYNNEDSPTDYVFLPFAGYLNYSNGSIYGTRLPSGFAEGYYWCSSFDGTKTNYLHIKLQSVSFSFSTYYYSGYETKAEQGSSEYRANAYSIRCVKE